MTEPAARTEVHLEATWKTTRRWFLAAAIALFPFIFILDAATDLPLSPVIPGMVAILVVWLLGPFLVMELLIRMQRASSRPRATTISRYAVGAACLWFLGWLVLA